MKLTLEPTGHMEKVEGQICRRWEGTTDEGVPVHVWIRLIQARTHDEAALAKFEEQLKELPHFERQLVSIDIRAVL